MNIKSLHLSLLFLLTSCAVGPDYQRPEIVSPDTWRVDLKTAHDVSNTKWWKQFKDPVLNNLIDIALKENKDVRIAAKRMQEFAARIDIANSGFLPQLGYDVNGSRNGSSLEAFGAPQSGRRTYNNYAASANFNWELDLWGKIRRLDEAATADYLAEEENRRSVILSLVSTVATTYITLRQLDWQYQVVKNTLYSRAETLRLFKLKFKGGVISALELAQVRTEYEQAAATIPPIERQVALTENELSILLGHNPGKIPRGKSIYALVLPEVPAGIPSTVLTQRPDVRAAEQALISTNARIGVAKAEYFPTISLTGLFGFASSELDNLLSSSAQLWNAGAAITGPIYQGGRLSGEVAANEAVQQQALTGYLQTIQGAFREVDDSLINVQKSKEQLSAEKNQIDAITTYVRLAKLRYDEGYSSYIEVLDAQDLLFDTQLQYIATQGDVYVSLISTYKAMGGGWVQIAQQTADETDFPPPENIQKDKQSGDTSQ